MRFGLFSKLCISLLIGVDPDEARKFVTSFYSSLAQNTERSHEPLDGKWLHMEISYVT